MSDTEKNGPKYKKIYETLWADIRAGRYQPGMCLPSERELGTLFCAQRPTIRKALDLLVRQGHVEKRTGYGNIVKDGAAKAAPRERRQTLLFVLPKSPNMVDRITEPFNTELFYYIERECRKNGFQLVYTTLSPEEDVETIPDLGEAMGVFLVSKHRESHLVQLKQYAFPMILVNNRHEGFVSVMTDNQKGASDAVDYLIGLGHRHIAAVAGIAEYETSAQRLTGFQSSMLQGGLDPREFPVEYGLWSFDGGLEAAGRLLGDPKHRPTAIFAFNDTMALGVMEGARRLGLSVPGDISVVGFDNIEAGLYASPALTTLEVNTAVMGGLAFRQMTLAMAGALESNIRIIIPTAMVYRKSAASPAG